MVMQAKLLVQAAGRPFEFPITLHDAVALRELVAQSESGPEGATVRLYGATDSENALVSILDESAMAIIHPADRNPFGSSVPVTAQVQDRKVEMQNELRRYGHVRLNQF